MSQHMDSQVDITCHFSEVSDETRNEEQVIGNSGKDYPWNKEGNQDSVVFCCFVEGIAWKRLN